MPNFKTLLDAAVTMGEFSQAEADYFHGLYLNSDEARDLPALRDTCAGWKKCDEETKTLLATVAGERDRLRLTLAQSEAYIRKMDGIIEEVGGVTVSCINPYEDLKRALQTLKARAEAVAFSEPKGADLHVRMALSCLDELEPEAMRRKARMVRNFNEHMERESQLSSARVSLDHALSALNPESGASNCHP